MREVHYHGKSDQAPVVDEALAKARRVRMLFPDYAVTLEDVTGDALPESHAAILLRSEHLTQMLQDYNSGPLELKVLDRHRHGSNYSRVITKAGGGRILEFAFITIDLDLCPPTVAADILAEMSPVGRILIDSGVPRELRVLGFCKIELAPGNRMFAVDRPTTTYGRYTTIALNGVPAIYVLELIAPVLD